MMNAITELLQQIPDPNLSLNERVMLRCELAKQFEKTGNHEAACRALDNSWPGLGNWPNLDGLDQRSSAQLLLRVGVLTGWIGSNKVIKGSQTIAEQLINESIAIFASLSDSKKVAEAQIEIGYCHAREGAFAVARELYVDALAQLDDDDGDLRALALLRSSILELSANRLNDSLNILTSATPLFAASTNHVLKGSFHNQLAGVLKRLGASEGRSDYIDRVLNEYAAASFHFEQAGHARYQGGVENNLAMLFLQLGRFDEAHEHLDRAQALHTRMDDKWHLANVEESRARVLLAEGAVARAAKVADTAIRTLEKSDWRPSFAEALTTQGIALAHLKRDEEARATFARAIGIAEETGDLERAGLAALALAEQLAAHLSEEELCAMLERARSFLKYTQNPATLHRLADCACRVLSMIHTAHPDWTTFSLNETLRRHEGRFIQMALEDSGGSVTKAAGLLGLQGHQSLSFILSARQQQLLSARTPIRPRRRKTFKVITPEVAFGQGGAK